MTTLEAPPSFPEFLSGGGQMGTLIRAHDWQNSPFGSPEIWPQSLRSALSICLNSSFPTAIYWGDDLRLLYNDAWSPIPSDRHPGALGQPGSEVWGDIWHVVGPQFEQVMKTGEGFSTYDQMLPIVRNGEVRETYWNYSFTAIRGEDGSVVGVFNQGNETTDVVLARRQADAEIDRLGQMFDQAPGAIAITRGPTHVFDVVNAAYEELTGRTGLVGKPVAEAMPEVVEQGFVRLLDSVFETGETFVGRAVPVILRREGGHDDERLIDFVYQPMTDSAGKRSGIFVQATDVTEVARAETALRDSEERYEAIVNSIDQMIWSTRPDGFHDYYNDRWYEFTGVPKGSTDGEAWNGMFHPEDQDRAWSVWRHCLETGDPYHIEYRLRHRSGQYRWVIGRAQCVRNDQGEIVRWFGSCTDIHDQKVAEEKLAEQARILEVLYAMGNVIASEIDLEQVVQMVTDAGVELTGAKYGAFFYNQTDEAGETYALYTLSGVPREAFADLPVPRNTHMFAPTFRGDGVVRSADVTSDPNYGQTAPHFGMPEGHLSVRSYLAVPVISRSGEVIGGLFLGHPEPGVFSDRSEMLMVGIAAQAAIAIDNATLFRSAQDEILARRLNETALRESEAFVRSVVESSNDGIKVMDLDGRLGFLNEKSREHLEIDDLSTAIGQEWATFWPDECAEDVARAMDAARAGGVGRFSAFRPTVKGTPKWWDVVVTPIMGEDGKPLRMVSISRDVTESRRAEEARQLVLRELDHRVKNLFAVATGMVSMTARGASSVEEMSTALKGRLSALAKAHELIRSAITSDAGRGSTSMAKLVGEVMRPHRDGAEAVAIALGGPDIMLSESAGTALALIIHELATNAVKYGALSAAGGRLEVSWRQAEDKVAIEWTETLPGASIKPPTATGFGTKLARSSATGQLGGSIDYDWRPAGVRVLLTIPHDQLGT